MTTLSRRSLLSATSIAMCAFATPAFTGRALANQLWQRHAKMDALVWLEVMRVHFQLRCYRDHLLRLLLRSPTMDADYRYLGFRQPHPAYMAAYRHASDHLIKALPTHGDGASMTPLDHDEVVEPILSLSMDAKDRRDLYRQCESDGCTENYCHVDAGWIRWDLRSMGPRCPQQMLAAFAKEISGFLESPWLPSDPIASIQNAEHAQLMTAFTTMPLETYWNLVLPLFQIAPESSPALLAVQRGNAKLVFGDIMRPMEHSYLYSTQMSMLSSFIMEYFANNHFSRIHEIAGMRETWGNWHGFMAGQILDVLYQKVIVLRRLAADGQVS